MSRPTDWYSTTRSSSSKNALSVQSVWAMSASGRSDRCTMVATGVSGVSPSILARTRDRSSGWTSSMKSVLAASSSVTPKNSRYARFTKVRRPPGIQRTMKSVWSSTMRRYRSSLRRSSASMRFRSDTSRTTASRLTSASQVSGDRLTSASNVDPSARRWSQWKTWGSPASAASIFSMALSRDGRPSGWCAGE